MTPANRGPEESVAPREIEKMCGSRPNGNQARDRCSIEASNREHRALIVAPAPLVAKRAMEFDALPCPDERFHMLQEPALCFVPRHISRDVHGSAPDHGSSRQPGQCID